MPVESGLGPQLVGERINVNSRTVQVLKQLGEGGFSFVYLVKEESVDNASTSESGGSSPHSSQSRSSGSSPSEMVLKITSIHSRQQRDIAEKEAKLLSRLSHPSIVRMYDTCYRSISTVGSGRVHSSHGNYQGESSSQSRPQHLILMEHCEGGNALTVCNALKSSGQRFDLPSLIIAFGQICNAVSYLHAQRPPIVHRDLKPVNFLVKNGAYKLCDFGSAIFGHVDLRTPSARSEAEEIIQKTTTQMFRAPEMVDLYTCKKLTQATDVWALGCCLYSLAFFQNCFEENSNLAILNKRYKIPEDNPYGVGLVELIDRMLTVDVRARADMTEVILCLSAIYSGRPLPARKILSKKKEEGERTMGSENGDGTAKVGTYRTDGQGIRQSVEEESKKPVEAKRLDPNSAAARRKRALGKQRANAGISGNDKAKLESSFGPFRTTADSFGRPVASKAPTNDLNLNSAFPAFAESDIPASGAGVFPDSAFDTSAAAFFDKQNIKKNDLTTQMRRTSLDDKKKGMRSSKKDVVKMTR